MSLFWRLNLSELEAYLILALVRNECLLNYKEREVRFALSVLHTFFLKVDEGLFELKEDVL